MDSQLNGERAARGQVTVREIKGATGANRNTIKAHLKKLTEQECLIVVGQGRGARYTRSQAG